MHFPQYILNLETDNAVSNALMDNMIPTKNYVPEQAKKKGYC